MKVKLKSPVVVRLEIDEMHTRQEWSEGRLHLAQERSVDGRDWAVTMALPDSAAIVIDAEQVTSRVEIPLSSGGVVVAEPLDWVLTGVNGERMPCRPSVFESLYEPA